MIKMTNYERIKNLNQYLIERDTKRNRKEKTENVSGTEGADERI